MTIMRFIGDEAPFIYFNDRQFEPKDLQKRILLSMVYWYKAHTGTFAAYELEVVLNLLHQQMLLMTTI